MVAPPSTRCAASAENGFVEPFEGSGVPASTGYAARAQVWLPQRPGGAVDVVERARPKAAIGAWCKPQGPGVYLCLTVIDEPEAAIYDCQAWLVRTDRRAGLEILRRGPAACPQRSMTPPSGVVAR